MINMDNTIEMMKKYPYNIIEMKAKPYLQSSSDIVQSLRKEAQMKDISN